MTTAKQDMTANLLRSLPWYTEGPVLDADGQLYFTTLQGGKILKMNNEGSLEDWAEGIRPNGQLILPDGDHLVCDSGQASISRYTPDGRLSGYDIRGRCAGIPVEVPNDLIVDSAGGVYFSDSIRKTGKVFYYHPEGKQRVIAEGLDFPNGLALSTDERTLFVAESYRNRILAISLDDSTPSGFRLFAALPENCHPAGYNLPDGIKLGKGGELWVAHYGMQAVQVLDKEGRLIRSIPLDFPLPSNLFLRDEELIVTGGYAEPGPGGVLRLLLK